MTRTDAPRLETERLILRLPQESDFEGWAAFYADPEATRFIGGPQPRAVVWRRFLAFAGAWAIQGFSTFSVVEKASGRWVGNCGPWHPEGWTAPEIGWSLRRESWGKGYAVEAARAALDWSFEQLDCERIIHYVPLGHAASQAVARRLGATLSERIVMPEPFAGEEVEVWSTTRDEWLARRGEHA